MSLTQKQKVINRINEVGFVDNFWAIENYILRLGAIIHDLAKNGGWKFNSRFGKGKDKKNFYYYKEGVQSNACCGEMKAFGLHYSPCKGN